MHKVDMRIGNRIFSKIRVAFFAKEKQSEDRLLGILDLFQNFQLALRATVQRNYFTLENPDTARYHSI